MPVRVRAMAASTGRATYFSGAAATDLDYFPISFSLQAVLLDVRCLEGAPVAKHVPVRLRFSGNARSHKVPVLARPPRRPAAPPLTCHPQEQPISQGE